MNILPLVISVQIYSPITPPQPHLAPMCTPTAVRIVQPTKAPKLTTTVAKLPSKTEGRVTWYGTGDKECLGCKKRADGKFHTATGEVLDDNALTCASNIHKLGTMVKITNKKSGLSVICRVNDRGGFKYPTLLDVSKATAIALGGLQTHSVTIEEVK